MPQVTGNKAQLNRARAARAFEKGAEQAKRASQGQADEYFDIFENDDVKLQVPSIFSEIHEMTYENAC